MLESRRIGGRVVGGRGGQSSKIGVIAAVRDGRRRKLLVVDCNCIISEISWACIGWSRRRAGGALEGVSADETLLDRSEVRLITSDIRFVGHHAETLSWGGLTKESGSGKDEKEKEEEREKMVVDHSRFCVNS